ncbi:hypothetical protein ACFVT5_14670 [Streptomyces sp. NPDC058001]|uniref:hypothetical protein n=1 Tax=Streptomyces sp. NPDC058001 TaxID=3346300 RepID=UPI0036E34B76
MGRPDEIVYYLACAPLGTPVAELVHIAGTRWAIEVCFQAAKNECGPDQYEIRRFPVRYRHITWPSSPTRSPLRRAPPRKQRRRAAETVPTPSHPLTVAEIRRLAAVGRPTPAHLRRTGHERNWSR